ncbi:MAG: DNA replication/repair protein RecF [Desulfuromonadales bacterium]
MILKNLKLCNYRNLQNADFSWNEHFNVICGQNAQGKTNLLEAIYLFGNLKSFRGARGQELINHTAETAWISACIDKESVQHRLDIGLQKSGRNPRVDGKTVNKLSQFLGYLRTVVFSPDELGIIKGVPAGRRSLLDRAILQTDPAYLDRVQEFERTLRQRNQLLKQQADANLLAPWTETLIRIGSRIRHDRHLYLERFLPKLRQVYREVTRDTEAADLEYSVASKPLSELATEMAIAIHRLAPREKKLGLTLTGPHRDDLDFLVNGKSLRYFGSQGQQRTFLLAFKAAQVMDLEEQFREPPVLLLDDLASELDNYRQSGFFSFLSKQKGQVFLTSVQKPHLADSVLKMASFFKVDQGLVTAISP